MDIDLRAAGRRVSPRRVGLVERCVGTHVVSLSVRVRRTAARTVSVRVELRPAVRGEARCDAKTAETKTKRHV